MLGNLTLSAVVLAGFLSVGACKTRGDQASYQSSSKPNRLTADQEVQSLVEGYLNNNKLLIAKKVQKPNIKISMSKLKEVLKRESLTVAEITTLVQSVDKVLAFGQSLQGPSYSDRLEVFATSEESTKKTSFSLLAEFLKPEKEFCKFSVSGWKTEAEEKRDRFSCSVLHSKLTEFSDRAKGTKNEERSVDNMLNYLKFLHMSTNLAGDNGFEESFVRLPEELAEKQEDTLVTVLDFAFDTCERTNHFLGYRIEGCEEVTSLQNKVHPRLKSHARFLLAQARIMMAKPTLNNADVAVFQWKMACFTDAVDNSVRTYDTALGSISPLLPLQYLCENAVTSSLSLVLQSDYNKHPIYSQWGQAAVKAGWKIFPLMIKGLMKDFVFYPTYQPLSIENFNQLSPLPVIPIGMSLDTITNVDGLLGSRMTYYFHDILHVATQVYSQHADYFEPLKKSIEAVSKEVSAIFSEEFETEIQDAPRWQRVAAIVKDMHLSEWQRFSNGSRMRALAEERLAFYNAVQAKWGSDPVCQTETQKSNIPLLWFGANHEEVDAVNVKRKVSFGKGLTKWPQVLLGLSNEPDIGGSAFLYDVHADERKMTYEDSLTEIIAAHKCIEGAILSVTTQNSAL